MPNKITDNEIIKALECCMKITTDCEKCPYWDILLKEMGCDSNV